MMKILAKIGVTFLLTGLVFSNAWADRGWHRPHSSVQFGVQIGAPWGYPPYYPYWPHIYMPPTVIVAAPPAPAIYVEQPPVVSTVPQLEPGYWYYCQEAGAYYPHVKQCPGDWHKVPPVPAR